MNRPLKVLFADDESDVQKMVVRRLESNGYAVLTARDGEEALRLARAEHPDVIILDVMMPKMTGDDVAVKLRESRDTAAIPIIFLTCLATPKDSEAVNGQSGTQWMLPKPLDDRRLLAILAEMSRRAA